MIVDGYLILKIHTIAGSIIFSFLLLHLSNHVVSLFGEEQHIKWIYTCKILLKC